jgi:hypothetical protein
MIKLVIKEVPEISGGGRRRRAWRRICHLKDEAFAVVLEASMVQALIYGCGVRCAFDAKR